MITVIIPAALTALTMAATVELSWTPVLIQEYTGTLLISLLVLIVTTWATSVVEGKKEGGNNRKEYHSTSRARKVRSEIVASYCNILKVSQVLTFSTLGHYSFPFYKRIERAPRLSYGTTKVHSLYPIFRPFPLPRASVTLSYPAKGIRADTPLAKYRHAAISNTLIRGRSARGPRTDVEGAIPRAVPSLGG